MISLPFRLFRQPDSPLAARRINQILLLICLGWATLLVGCSDSDTVSTLGDWRRRSDFEGVARNAAAGFVIGSVAYMGTGTNADNERLKDF